MNQASSRIKVFLQPECWLAAGITLLIVYCHFHFWRHAGGLWRDEVNSLNVARANSISGWTKDSFPVLMPALLHGWIGLGFGKSDLDLRLFGLLVGLSIPCALWLTAWKEKKLPLFGLTLFGLNSILIIFGDSIRAYGLGCLTIILAAATTLGFLRQPSWPRFIFLVLAFVAGVQTLYNNAVLVAAICAGAMAVCARRKAWRAIAQIFSAGAIAAVSLLPYWTILNPANTSAIVLKTGLKRWRFLAGLSDTFGFPLPQYVFAWAILAIIIVALAIFVLRRKTIEQGAIKNSDGELQLFAATTLICAATGFCLFLWLAAMPSQSWYWLPPMAVAAVCLDVTRPVLRGFFRIIFFVFIAATVLIAFPISKRSLNFHFTNADILARELNARISPDDYAVVVPWFCGISFGHYFNGAAKWDTLPPLADHATHRYDLVKNQLQNTNAIAPLMKKISTTLRSGHRVWILAADGWMNIPESGTTAAQSLPSAPLPATGWSEMPYTLVWDSQVAHFVSDHSLQFERIKISAAEFSAAENLELFVAAGWKDLKSSTTP